MTNTVTITTQYRTDASGKGKITAKGNGRQKTISYRHDRSPAQNHGDAAGVFLLNGAYPSVDAIEMVNRAVQNGTADDLGDGKWRFSL